MALFSGGLREFDERQELVILQPAHWAAAQYDTVRQRSWRMLSDAAGNRLPLLIPYTEETRTAVAALEAYQPAENALVLGLLRLVDGVLCVEPVSAIEGERVLSFTLGEDAAGQPETADEPPDSAEDWTADEPEATGALPTAAGAILNEALADVEQTAESGLAAAIDTARAEETAARCDTLFLGTPASGMRKLGRALARAQREPSPEARADAAAALLRAYYIFSLARRLEVVEGALAPLRIETQVRSLPK